MIDKPMVEHHVKQFYNRIKFPGEYTTQQLSDPGTVDNNLYLSFINKYLNQGQCVLDIGCGSGLVTNAMAQRHICNFTALDFADSIEIGRSYAKKHALTNVTWVKNNFLTHNFHHQFDVVICQGVLHHIPDHRQALEKIKSLISPNGVLLLGVYNPFGKLLKKIKKIKYNSDILMQDQEHNPYETSFRAGTVIDMCQPLTFLEATPGGTNKYACDVLSLFNSQNGGLTLYAFRNKLYV